MIQVKTKILVLSPNAAKLIPSINKLLLGAGVQDIAFYTEMDIINADIVLVDHAVLDQGNNLELIRKHISKVAILVSLADFDEIKLILNKTKAHHLFGLSGPNSLSDIKDFIIYAIEHKKWTVETLMPKPLKVTSSSISTSQNLSDQVEHLLESHDFSQCFTGAKTFLAHILDEALSNALFSAPVDQSGQYLYRNRTRSEAVQMIPGKEVEAKVYYDQKKFIIKVKDFYGSLSPKEIFESLPVGEIRAEAGGAGIGMFLMFKYSHKYIVNLEPGHSTECLIVVENEKQFKIYDMKEKSFHLFTLLP